MFSIKKNFMASILTILLINNLNISGKESVVLKDSNKITLYSDSNDKNNQIVKSVELQTNKTIEKPEIIISDDAINIFKEYAREYNLVDTIEFNSDYSIGIKRGDKKLTISQNDLKELFKIVYYESNIEPYNGKIAVVNVILNRVFKYNKSIIDIIYEKNQFSPVSEGKMKKDTYNIDCIKAVFEGIIKTKIFSDDVLYFCEPEISTSKWMINNRTFVMTIGNHYFYK